MIMRIAKGRAQLNSLADALSELPNPAKKLKSLSPSYLDPSEWRPGGRLARQAEPPGWRGIRAAVLERDGCCVYCAHEPGKGVRDRLEVNHLNGFRDNRPEALETVCVLCHRVLHAGRSAAIHGSLLLYRRAAVDQNTVIRLCWHLRRATSFPIVP